MPKPRFVFNDEAQKNSYGFIIPSKGIDLKRFKKNPIMLDSHNNSSLGVIGRWEDVQLDKGLLSAIPVFDSEDGTAAIIEGKVARGFIKSCSMGVRFERENMKFINDVLILEKCELYEASIVPVPSNPNAIRLYVGDSEMPLSETEIQTLCLSALPVEAEVIIPTQNPENNDMKITLTLLAALALGFKADELEHEAVAINERIVQLDAEKKAAELKLSALTTAAEQKALEAIKAKVQLAHKAGKIAANKIEDFVNLGIANEALLDSTIASIPAKVSLAAQIAGGDAGTGDETTVEDFMKLSLEQQLAFKADSPDAYKKLFNQKN